MYSLKIERQFCVSKIAIGQWIQNRLQPSTQLLLAAATTYRHQQIVRHFAKPAGKPAGKGRVEEVYDIPPIYDPRTKPVTDLQTFGNLPPKTRFKKPELVRQVLPSGIVIHNKIKNVRPHIVQHYFLHSKTVVFFQNKCENRTFAIQDKFTASESNNMKLIKVPNQIAIDLSEEYPFHVLATQLCQGPTTLGFINDNLTFTQLQALMKLDFNAIQFLAAFSNNTVYTPARLATVGIETAHIDIVKALYSNYQNLTPNLSSAYSILSQIGEYKHKHAEGEEGFEKEQEKT